MNTCDVADIESPLLREMFAYWLAKRSSRHLPARSNFDPLIEAPRLVPHLMLIERHADGRLRYRLVGTSVATCMGSDPTGNWVERTKTSAAKPPGTGDQVAQLLDSAVEQNGPTYGHVSFQMASGLWINCHWLTLPLAGDGVTVDMLLTGLVQSSRPEALSLSLPHAKEEIWSIRLPPL